MADGNTGATTGTTCTDEGGGDESWSGTLNDVFTDNFSGPNASPGGGDEMNRIRMVNFPWSTPIPSSGITIVGVEVTLTWDQSSGGDFILTEAYVMHAGSTQGSNQAADEEPPTSPGDVTIGGPADMWGMGSVSKAMADSSSFGFQFKIVDDRSGSDDIDIDYIVATIYWDNTGGGGSPTHRQFALPFN